MSNEEFFDMFLSAVKEAYIKIYGAEKWYRLTDEQKHDATMILAKDMLKALS